MQPTADHIYTPEEANALLPSLRERLARIRDARQVLLESAELVRERVAADPGGAHGGREYWEASAALREELEGLAAADIVLRDPEAGLVDFPGEREGRRVWLCWRVGEERVAFWHELEGGFVGRRPL
ncbi:MAG TPA: DUF2203 domain-containing protein [Actinomycetota bacterium]|nr:DUF2203 domain-containing protein [Actinomycetota bacterium]